MRRYPPAATVHLIAGDHVVQQNASGRIVADKLLAEGKLTGVNLDFAPNSVNTIAGKSGSHFLFTNDKSLTVGDVGGIAGINVTNTGTGDALVDISVSGSVAPANLMVDPEHYRARRYRWRREHSARC